MQFGVIHQYNACNVSFYIGILQFISEAFGNIIYFIIKKQLILFIIYTPFQEIRTLQLIIENIALNSKTIKDFSTVFYSI